MADPKAAGRVSQAPLQPRTPPRGWAHIAEGGWWCGDSREQWQGHGCCEEEPGGRGHGTSSGPCGKRCGGGDTEETPTGWETSGAPPPPPPPRRQRPQQDEGPERDWAASVLGFSLFAASLVSDHAEALGEAQPHCSRLEETDSSVPHRLPHWSVAQTTGCHRESPS